MIRGLQGRYVRILSDPEPFDAFVPFPLPPDPPIHYDAALEELRDEANRALGRLDSISTLLPDPSLFLYFYVRKEAVLSSQIEGTQSSLSDLLLYETEERPGVPLGDVEEVSRYVAAMNHGLARLREGFPLSLRLLREIHGVLLEHGRGSERTPGEFRTSQNWIGGTRPGNALFVPPPAHELMPALGALEAFFHQQPSPTPVLLMAAFAHVQFETIHPFLDGNGRLGRLLVTFLLWAAGALTEPLLYLSLYFKMNRDAYYSLLQRVRLEGDWEAWLGFFLDGIRTTAEQGTRTAHRVLELLRDDQARILGLGRAAASAHRLHSLMSRHPLITIGRASAELGLSHPTVTSSMQHLQNLGIVRESTGRRRDRLFAYDTYLSILEEGTTAPPRS